MDKNKMATIENANSCNMKYWKTELLEESTKVRMEMENENAVENASEAKMTDQPLIFILEVKSQLLRENRLIFC